MELEEKIIAAEERRKYFTSQTHALELRKHDGEEKAVKKFYTCTIRCGNVNLCDAVMLRGEIQFTGLTDRICILSFQQIFRQRSR